jgi:hypothetical protein
MNLVCDGQVPVTWNSDCCAESRVLGTGNLVEIHAPAPAYVLVYFELLSHSLFLHYTAYKIACVDTPCGSHSCDFTPVIKTKAQTSRHVEWAIRINGDSHPRSRQKENDGDSGGSDLLNRCS